MGADDYLEHKTYDRVDGALVLVCDTWERLATFYTGGRAENIAGGYATAGQVVDGWLNSPGHRANILSDSVWEIGVGYYSTSTGFRDYWVQDFGVRSGVYPLIINGEAATTDSTSVSLYIYGEWDELRLRNENGAWTAWQPFQASLDWTLSAGGGERTVTAELRTGTQVVTTSDTITLASQEKGQPTLEDLPDSIQFTYSIPSQRLYPAYFELTPQVAGGGDTFTWAITVDSTFFTANPTQGTTPQSITIMPASFDYGAPGDYAGTITLTVIDPPGVVGSPQVISVFLSVTNSEIHENFLPGLQHNK
jgi:hypothetical protein